MEFLQQYGLSIVIALIGIGLALYLAANAKAREVALMGIAMAYKMTMTELMKQAQGMTPEQRKQFAMGAYDKLPAVVYGVPIKTFISREKFGEIVEQLFQEMIKQYSAGKAADVELAQW